jgi:hypothetical protein
MRRVLVRIDERHCALAARLLVAEQDLGMHGHDVRGDAVGIDDARARQLADQEVDDAAGFGARASR